MASKTTLLAFLCGLLAITATAVEVSRPTCALVDCIPGNKCIETPTGPKCIPINSCVCPEIYDPVCCKTPTGIKTTSNSCFCECEPKNVVISSDPCPTCANIRCKDGYRCVETKFGPRCEPITACRCTTLFDPVCCKLPDGKIVTKSNPCQCTTCNPGATIIANDACPRTPPPDCFLCATIFDPVCCQVKNLPKFTASSPCDCRCRKGKVVSNGQCQ